MAYKRGGVYHYRFMWYGRLIRKSTHVSNKRDAEQIEAAERTRLAKGEVGINKKPKSPTLERALSVASMNRELATLRRMLRLAQEWMLDRVPRIRLLRGERQRDFVLSHRLEPQYLDATPHPSRTWPS